MINFREFSLQNSVGHWLSEIIRFQSLIGQGIIHNDLIV